MKLTNIYARNFGRTTTREQIRNLLNQKENEMKNGRVKEIAMLGEKPYTDKTITFEYEGYNVIIDYRGPTKCGNAFEQMHGIAFETKFAKRVNIKHHDDIYEDEVQEKLEKLKSAWFTVETDDSVFSSHDLGDFDGYEYNEEWGAYPPETIILAMKDGIDERNSWGQ